MARSLSPYTSQIDPNDPSIRPPEIAPGTAPLPRGINKTGRTYVRDVNPEEETVEGRLGGLLNARNAYLKSARDRGLRMANRRGIANSSLAAAAVEGQAIDAAMPIASQDAGTYAQKSLANQAALNQSESDQLRLDSEQQRAFAQASASSESASRRLQERQLDIEEAERERKWRTGERLGSEDFTRGESRSERDWRTGERIGGQDFTRGETRAEYEFRTGERIGDQEWQGIQAERNRAFQAQQNEASAREGWMNRIGQTVFDNPEYLRDPQAAAGMISFFTRNFDSWYNRYFPSAGKPGG